jgi:hypothetical protein
MFVKLFGRLVTAVGLFLAAVAVIAWFASTDQTGHYVAIFFGSMALILLLIGHRWSQTNRSTSWRNDPATDRQKDFAKELGIRFPKRITKGQLSDLISKVTGK